MAIFQPREGQKLLRYEIFPWEGLNMIVGENLTKKGESVYLENFRSSKIGWLDKRAGHALFGASLNADANYGLYDFITDRHILIRVAKVSGTVSIYRFSEQNNSWVQLLGLGTGLSQSECDFMVAANRCFIVNGLDNNRYIDTDGSTVVDSTSVNGHLFNSPVGRLTAFYKSRIYVGDYLNLDGSRERTGICFSSVPLGIVALVAGDQPGPAITTVNVTDTRYIKVGIYNDQLDVFRGGDLIGTLTVTDKQATSLTILSSDFNLLSDDELWVHGTRSSEKQFRWDNRATGISTHVYDNFYNASSEDLVAMENVNNNLLIFTRNSINLWNGAALRPLDLNIGCVSRKSFVKILGQAIFLHYTGIYSSTGGVPTLLSAKIQPLFNAANKISLENACGAIDGFSYFVYVGQITFTKPDGSIKKIMNDVVVEYNLRQNNFFIHTDIPMSHFIAYTQNGNLKLLFAKHATPSLAPFESLFAQDTSTIALSPTMQNINLYDATLTSEDVTVSLH